MKLSFLFLLPFFFFVRSVSAQEATTSSLPSLKEESFLYSNQVINGALPEGVKIPCLDESVKKLEDIEKLNCASKFWQAVFVPGKNFEIKKTNVSGNTQKQVQNVQVAPQEEGGIFEKILSFFRNTIRNVFAKIVSIKEGAFNFIRPANVSFSKVSSDIPDTEVGDELESFKGAVCNLKQSILPENFKNLSACLPK